MNILRGVLLALVSVLLPLTNVVRAMRPVAADCRCRREGRFLSGAVGMGAGERHGWSVANGTFGNERGRHRRRHHDDYALSRRASRRPRRERRRLRRTSPSAPACAIRARPTRTSWVSCTAIRTRSNYYELVVSATGLTRLRAVFNGIAVDKSATFNHHIPRNQWFEVEVRWNHGETTVKVNGLNIGIHVTQTEFTSGRIGLVTHGAVGTFDKVFLGVPFGEQPFFETFDQAPFVTFAPQSGQWSVVNGTYRNSAVQQTNVTLAPITTGFFPNQGDTMEYTFRARMLNPYGGSGNTDRNRLQLPRPSRTTTEVVFSPTGVVKLNRYRERCSAYDRDGERTTVARNVVARRAADQENGSDHFAVQSSTVSCLFEDVQILWRQPEPRFRTGGVGLITHWAPGRVRQYLDSDRGVFTTLRADQSFNEQPARDGPLSAAPGTRTAAR